MSVFQFGRKISFQRRDKLGVLCALVHLLQPNYKQKLARYFFSHQEIKLGSRPGLWFCFLTQERLPNAYYGFWAVGKCPSQKSVHFTEGTNPSCSIPKPQWLDIIFYSGSPFEGQEVPIRWKVGSRLVRVLSPPTSVFWGRWWWSTDTDPAERTGDCGGSRGGYFVDQACQWHLWAEVVLAGIQPHDHTGLQGRLGIVGQTPQRRGKWVWWTRSSLATRSHGQSMWRSRRGRTGCLWQQGEAKHPFSCTVTLLVRSLTCRPGLSHMAARSLLASLLGTHSLSCFTEMTALQKPEGRWWSDLLSRDWGHSLASVDPCMLSSHFERLRICFDCPKNRWGMGEPGASPQLRFYSTGCVRSWAGVPAVPWSSLPMATAVARCPRHGLRAHEAGSGTWNRRSEGTCRGPRELTVSVWYSRNGQVCVSQGSFCDSVYSINAIITHVSLKSTHRILEHGSASVPSSRVQLVF